MRPLERSTLRRLSATTLLLLACVGFPGHALANPPANAAARTCGSFVDEYRYTVSRSGRVTCRFAMRIVRSFIKNHAAWQKHSLDGTLAGTYYTHRLYRGWRCFEGSGGGSCSRGRRSASYQSAPQ